ncbi:MAG: VOC family protein [Anaerolineae bacterium]|jgi:glyoxylase I family protein|nr:VOC family protein [Chloroflexota bacterium]
MKGVKAHHIALRTPDFARAKAFYTEVLELPVAAEMPGRDCVFIDIGGTTIELTGAPDQAPGAAGALAHIAFEVDDIDETFAELKAKGVEFFIEPRDAGVMRIAFFRDPDGNALELFKSSVYRW